MKVKTHLIGLIYTFLAATNSVLAASCPSQGIQVQVLGSGGPEVQDKRASSSYLVWIDGKARVLVDAGGGSALRFGQSGAQVQDLAAVVFTHFHIDHSADFPALIKSSFFENRTADLPVFGPDGNALLPAANIFAKRLFAANNGVWPYMSDYLPGSRSGDYALRAQTIPTHTHQVRQVFKGKDFTLSAIPVHHGPIPALAWRVDLSGKAVVFSGDMNGQFHTLEKLAKDADLLVAHNAVPQGASGVAANLHMPPSVIGEIAAKAGVKQLVLSHRMLRTLGREKETLGFIRKQYSGPVRFADDLSCYAL